MRQIAKVMRQKTKKKMKKPRRWNKNDDDAQSCFLMSTLCRFMFASFALTEQTFFSHFRLLHRYLRSFGESVNEAEEKITGGRK